MAAPHVFAAVSIRDAKGKVSTMKINFPDEVNIGMVKDFLNGSDSGLGIIDALIKGQVVSAGIGLEVDLPAGLKAAPLPDSDVEEGARFSFRTSTGSITGYRIPTFDEAKIVQGSRNVDTTDEDVSDWIDRMTEGRTVGLENASPSDDRGADVVALESARESFTSSRN